MEIKKEVKNGKHIIKFLFILFFLFFSGYLITASEVKVYDVSLIIDQNNFVEFNSIAPKKAKYIDESVNISEYSNVFLLKMLSADGKVLHQIYFSPSFIILSDPPILLNESYVSLNLPYFSNTKYLKVYYQGEEKLSVDISQLLCNNNGKCDGSENYLSCPSDCKWYGQDGLCLGAEGAFNLSLDYWEDYFCDLDCYKDDDCNKENCNDGIKNQDETSIDVGGVCDIIYANCGNGFCGKGEHLENCREDCYFTSYIKPETISLRKGQTYTINATINCFDYCESVIAYLHYQKYSSTTGFFVKIFNFVLSLIRKPEVTGFVIVPETGKIFTTPENPKLCRNLMFESCNLNWQVKASSTGTYQNYLVVKSNAKEIKSNYIKVSVVR